MTLLNKTKGSLVGFLRTRCFSLTCQRFHVGSDRYSSSRLLSGYFKCRKIGDAEKLFGEMPDRDVVSYSIMVHGYAKNGYFKKSMESFYHMRLLNLVPNSFTMVGVLVCIVGLGDSMVGQSVHALVVKFGLESDLIVGTAVLDMYAKCGNILESYQVFERLKNPGLISCNAIIAGFMYNNFFEEGLVLFNRFREFGLVPNESTMLTLIGGCVALGSQRLSEALHAIVMKFGLLMYVSVSNALLNIYSNLTDYDAANKLFDEIECKDVISWTTIMGLLLRLENVHDVFKFFLKMRYFGVSPDTVIFIYLISASAILGDLERGREIHAQAVVCGFGSELALVNSLIAMYFKAGDLDSSMAVFNLTAEKSAVSWSAMISGYMHSGFIREALTLFIQVRQNETLLLDSTMLVGALTASGQLAALEFCQQLHCSAFVVGFSQSRMVLNSLISTYSKCGTVELACNVFKEMDHLRDIVSWNAIIYACGINGQGKAALDLYKNFRSQGEDPDSATYLCILSACGHSGLVESGLMIFNQMVEESRIMPSGEHYGCVVDMLARAGCLQDAIGFANKILRRMNPNVWRALLSGCVVHGNLELAAGRLLKQDVEEPDQFVLLSNVYASLERFQDAEALRLSLKRKGLTKNPGISLLSE
ncbi:Pentatricopeptide repeat-containing protein [Quillaja saponaria]|uniref:Pentatricopeptide repeat-containing protein n=1 Tax=Quillaja saponaria TaxID=32244 RepID=A0AAD7PU21_QUISA|nr:Pentatricopeptide repeat-containing protein [Quillaja saponaria]